MGKRHVQLFDGMCPQHTIKPNGKKLQVSFLGGRPYINYITDPIGGTDFILTKLFAKKHGFIPKFIPAMNLDIDKSNETKHGLTYWVRITRKVPWKLFTMLHVDTYDPFSRFHQSNVRLALGRFLLLPIGTKLSITCLICMLTSG